jgi:hypothetical protein
MMVLSLPAESGPHDIIRHVDVKRLWARKCRSEEVRCDTFAFAVFDAIADRLVPGEALDEKGCAELAAALDADNSGNIAVGEMRMAFPPGLTFQACIALILAKDGTLSLPMPPAVFLGRGAHIDAAMDVWRGSAAGALVVVAPGAGVGKSAFAAGAYLLHSSTFWLNVTHILWDTLGSVSVSEKKDGSG